MIAKRVKTMLAALVISSVGMGVGLNVYADTSVPVDTNETVTETSCAYGYGDGYGSGYRNGKGIGRGTGHGFGGFRAVDGLVEKLSLTDDEINAISNGETTVSEIAKQKGFDLDALKEEMLQDKYELIDEAVENGRLTAEQAKTIKTTLKENMENCDEPFSKLGKNRVGRFNNSNRNFGQRRGMAQGKGRGRMQ